MRFWIFLASAVIMAVGLIGQADPVFASDITSWRTSIARIVASKQVYPRSALVREVEGTAKVRVTTDRSGAIKDYEVIEATGQTVLDKEIGRLMDRVNPLPTPPKDASDDDLTFVLPLSWVLN